MFVYPFSSPEKYNPQQRVHMQAMQINVFPKNKQFLKASVNAGIILKCCVRE